MTEKFVQTYVRAPNGDLYCIDDDGHAFRSERGSGEQKQDADVTPTSACHVMPDHIGTTITPETELPGPEGANILPDGMGTAIVPDQMAADTVPDGIGTSIIPDGMGASIVPDGVGQQIVPDDLGQHIRS